MKESKGKWMKQQKVIFKGYNLGPRRQILHVLSHMWILVSIIIYVYLYGNKCTRSPESKKKHMAGGKNLDGVGW